MSSTKAAATEIRELIHTLVEIMNSAQGAYEVWYTLAGEDKGYEYYSAELQGKYSDFFQSVRNAHFKVMFTDIACLFDCDDRAPSSSFHKLEKSLRKDGYDDIAKRIKCAISSHTCLINRIRGFRNKRIAHHNPSWAEKRILKEYGVTPNKIKSLLETFNELLVVAYKDVVGSDTAYPIVRPGRLEEATFRLLRDLKGARKS